MDSSCQLLTKPYVAFLSEAKDAHFCRASNAFLSQAAVLSQISAMHLSQMQVHATLPNTESNIESSQSDPVLTN